VEQLNNILVIGMTNRKDLIDEGTGFFLSVSKFVISASGTPFSDRG
jgi:hypothetical protein